MKKLKKVPVFRTDEEAESFVANADLRDYDLSDLVPARFEFKPKNARLDMRLPSHLLSAVKARARERGMPYTRLIRETLELSLTRAAARKRGTRPKRRA